MHKHFTTVGHVLQHHFPYTGTALQSARQLQLMLSEADVRQSSYGDRENPAELAAAAHETARVSWLLPFRIWSTNLAVFMQREQWSREQALLVYDPVHLPAVRAHRNVIFVMAGKPWMIGSRKRKDRFRKFLNQVAWRSAQCVVATETRGLRAYGVEARAGEFLFRRVRPNLWHIPPFVDTELFHPSRAQERLKALHPVIYCGELSRRNGFFLMAETFQRFSAICPEATLFLSGYGRNRAGLADAMDVLREAGLASRTYFLGDLPEAALPEIFASSRLAVFPLLRDIDRKIPALQAMASGAATLSTSLGGLEDLPTVKCEPTAAGLLQAMLSAWENPTLGNLQREQVSGQFALANWQKAWLDLLSEQYERMRPATG